MAEVDGQDEQEGETETRSKRDFVEISGDVSEWKQDKHGTGSELAESFHSHRDSFHPETN